MLFDSSIRKDLARSFWASSLVLFAIVMTLVLIRTLELAERGKFNPEEITLALGYSSLSRLPTILAVTLLIAVVSVLTRMHRDSEMPIWQNAGMGLWHVVRPILKFAWPMWVAILVLQLVVWPWANQQMDLLRSRYEQRDDLQRIQPGKFQESADGRRVFYIGVDGANTNQGKQVFIQAQTTDGMSILSAATGKIVNKENGNHLLVTEGQRVDHKSADGSIKWIEFDTYSTLVQAQEGNWRVERADHKSSRLLWQEATPVTLAELGWRIGMALMAVNFVLLGVAAVQMRSRTAKGASLAFAAATAVVYFNLLNIGKGWVSMSVVHPWLWLLMLHGSVFVVSVGWLSYRHHQKALPWTRRSASMTPLQASSRS